MSTHINKQPNKKLSGQNIVAVAVLLADALETLTAKSSLGFLLTFCAIVVCVRQVLPMMTFINMPFAAPLTFWLVFLSYHTSPFVAPDP